MSLTPGMVRPKDLEHQKEEYTRILDDQQRQAEAVLSQQKARQIEDLRMQAEHQKALAMSHWDKQLRAKEVIAEQEYQQELARLQESTRQLRLALQQQSAQLIVEYSARQVQEEVNLRRYEIDLEHWEAEQELGALRVPSVAEHLRAKGQLAARHQQAARRVVEDLPEFPIDRSLASVSYQGVTSASPYPPAGGRLAAGY